MPSSPASSPHPQVHCLRVGSTTACSSQQHRLLRRGECPASTSTSTSTSSPGGGGGDGGGGGVGDDSAGESVLLAVGRHLLWVWPAEERARILRFRRQIDALRSMASHLLGKSTAVMQWQKGRGEQVEGDGDGSPWRRWRWTRTAHGKPHLLQHQQHEQPAHAPMPMLLNFNTSHSGDWVVCGLVADGRHVVGVDVEQVPYGGAVGGGGGRGRSTPWHEYLRIMNTNFTDREWWDQIITRENTPFFVCGGQSREMEVRGDVPQQAVERIFKRFIAHWTLKESFIKALGSGVSFGELTRIEFRFHGMPDYGGEYDLCELPGPSLFVDGVMQPQWHFRCMEINGSGGGGSGEGGAEPGSHMVSVALGPAHDKYMDKEYARMIGVSDQWAMNSDTGAMSGDEDLNPLDSLEMQVVTDGDVIRRINTMM